MTSPNTSLPETDEISLKDLIIKIKEWYRYLAGRWLVFCCVGMIGGAIGFAYATFQKPVYIATLTFALEEEKSGSNGLAGAIGLASSLGIDIGGGSAGGAFSGSNLMELMKSRTLIEKALLQPISISGKTISLADYFINFSGLNKEWDKNPLLKNIRFEPLSDRKGYSRQQDSILGTLYTTLVGVNGLLSVAQKDKKVSIISISCKTGDELFSKVFTETVAKVASDFYVETKSQKAKLNYTILQKQTDSIRNELNRAITGVALANDNTYNLNPGFNIQRVPSVTRQVDVQANTAMLTQLVANLEMAKVSLRKETPLIQVIDTPILPLLKEKTGRLRSLVTGSFLAVFLVFVFLVVRRIWFRMMWES